MEIQALIERVQNLSDLELATLLCLIARQHCCIEVGDELVDELAQELALIVSETFGLSYVVLSENEQDTIEDFGDSILDHSSKLTGRVEDEIYGRDFVHSDNDSRFGGFHDTYPSGTQLDTRKVVNVVITKNFNSAPEDVQVQALELIVRRRIFSRTTVHIVPDDFLFLAIVPTSSKEKRFMKHLNDRIFISHRHEVEDGFPHVEDMGDGYMSDDRGSGSSSMQGSQQAQERSRSSRFIDSEMIQKLRVLGEAASISPEVRAYMQNIVVFLRIERGVAGGVSPCATVLFEALSKYLAPLHNLDYVTPSLVALAAKKIYPHRIQIAPPEKERSMQYGSDLNAVQELLVDITPETVIEAVLNSVECPL